MAEEIEATAAARRRAEELGVDLTQVEGSGEMGKITAKDVEAWERAQPSRFRFSVPPALAERGFSHLLIDMPTNDSALLHEMKDLLKSRGLSTAYFYDREEDPSSLLSSAIPISVRNSPLVMELANLLSKAGLAEEGQRLFNVFLRALRETEDKEETAPETTPEASGRTPSANRKLNVVFSEAASDALKELGKQRNKSISDVVRDAIALQEWFIDTRRDGARILVEKRGQAREIIAIQ